MVQTRNLLQELLSTIADFRPKFRSDKDNTSITELSKNLLGVDDETSQQRIGKLILGKYEQLEEDEKKAFFQFLTDEMDLDSHAILSHVKDYQHHRNAGSLSKLLDASEPLRQDFLRG